ncbi:hypothetical protein Tco_1292783 [Tanacetum coccineum]
MALLRVHSETQFQMFHQVSWIYLDEIYCTDRNYISNKYTHSQCLDFRDITYPITGILPLDASCLTTESMGQSLKGARDTPQSGNDAHTNDADIKPIYDEEPMAEVQTTAGINVFAIGQ